MILMFPQRYSRKKHAIYKGADRRKVCDIVSTLMITTRSELLDEALLQELIKRYTIGDYKQRPNMIGMIFLHWPSFMPDTRVFILSQTAMTD